MSSPLPRPNDHFGQSPCSALALMPVGAESCVAHALCAIALAALAVLGAHTDVALLRQTVGEIVIVSQATLSNHPY